MSHTDVLSGMSGGGLLVKLKKLKYINDFFVKHKSSFLDAYIRCRLNCKATIIESDNYKLDRPVNNFF